MFNPTIVTGRQEKKCSRHSISTGDRRKRRSPTDKAHWLLILLAPNSRDPGPRFASALTGHRRFGGDFLLVPGNFITNNKEKFSQVFPP